MAKRPYERKRIPKTPQQFLNLILKTSSLGGFPSSNGNYCQYFNKENGKRCPIGLLIKNSDYRHTFENCGVGETAFPKQLLPSWLTFNQAKEVQNAHDGQAFNSYWDHTQFKKSLTKCSVFQNCKFPY